ncbi:hypothetical protein CDEST_13201 [Colletotrichum destructivum]|uniref:Uncharacterized protein n=1 Tax=Colletotrichum destructivum TaxID=34406 RepID=A0AAX4IYJ2_9PEZI|nr:hypothetical protein CDEST_13201 [Colletotrichum destructivum]
MVRLRLPRVERRWLTVAADAGPRFFPKSCRHRTRGQKGAPKGAVDEPNCVEQRYKRASAYRRPQAHSPAKDGPITQYCVRHQAEESGYIVDAEHGRKRSANAKTADRPTGIRNGRWSSRVLGGTRQNTSSCLVPRLPPKNSPVDVRSSKRCTIVAATTFQSPETLAFGTRWMGCASRLGGGRKNQLRVKHG